MNVTLIGMGSGQPENLTLQGLAALRQADLILGARRLLAVLPAGCTENRAAAYRPDEVAELLWQWSHPAATATQAGNPPFAAEVALVGTGVARLDGTLANAPILPGSVRLTNRETVVAGETLGSGNGAAATFDFTLANAPNAANVVIRWTSGGAAKSATIAGNTATGDGTPASTTIDRATGQIHLDAA